MTTDTEKDSKITVDINEKVIDINNISTEHDEDDMPPPVNLEHEKTIPFWQAIKKYKKAVFWALVISHTTIMEAYDTSLIGSLIAFTPFVEKFGTLNSSGKYAISAAWQSGVSNAAGCGQVFGLILAGLEVDRFGYRYTMIFNLLLFGALVFIVFFAPSLQVLVVGEVLCGIPWGAFQTLTVTYAADCTPVVLRPYLTTYINICWSLGKFLSAGVLRALLNKTDISSYRTAIAIQWIWPIPLSIAIFFAPESPLWLLKKNRITEAKHAIRKLTSNNEEFESMYSSSYYTNCLEESYNNNSSYLDLFKGVEKTKTALVIWAWVVQALCGSALTAQAAFFFQSAGLSTTHSFDLNMVNNVIGFFGTITLWILMKKIGRRLNIIGGLAIHCAILLVIGCLGINNANGKHGWAIGAMVLALEFVYSVTLGPLAYMATGELPSARLRAKAGTLGRNCYIVCTIGRGVITPFMLNTTAWNWGAKAGFFWLGFCVIFSIVSFFIYPETHGRTATEIDYLFQHKVSLRKFHKTDVSKEVAEEAQKVV